MAGKGCERMEGVGISISLVDELSVDALDI